MMLRALRNENLKNQNNHKETRQKSKNLKKPRFLPVLIDGATGRNAGANLYLLHIL
jgi:hypothetical protein